MITSKAPKTAPLKNQSPIHNNRLSPATTKSSTSAGKPEIAQPTYAEYQEIIKKLNQQGTLKVRKMRELAKDAGFTYNRTTGDHEIYYDAYQQIFVMPINSQDVPHFISQQLVKKINNKISSNFVKSPNTKPSTNTTKASSRREALPQSITTINKRPKLQQFFKRITIPQFTPTTTTSISFSNSNIQTPIESTNISNPQLPLNTNEGLAENISNSPLPLNITGNTKNIPEPKDAPQQVQPKNKVNASSSNSNNTQNTPNKIVTKSTPKPTPISSPKPTTMPTLKSANDNNTKDIMPILPDSNSSTISILNKEARQQNHDSIYTLAMLYKEGEIVDQDIELANKLFKHIADRHPAAAFHYGLACYTGNGVNKDDNAAFYYMQKAATYQLPSAQYVLGWFYYNGIGVSSNTDSALELFIASAENKCTHKCTQALQSIADIYIKRNQCSAAIKWLEKAACHFPDCHVKLAALYAIGKGVNQDYEKSWVHIELAAQNISALDSKNLHNIRVIIYNLGLRFANMSTLDSKTFCDPYAIIYNLGLTLANNIEDYQKAFKCFLIAGKLGNYDACAILAEIYLEGLLNLPKNIELATGYLKKLAKLGSSEACFNLAKIYFEGMENVSPDIELAIEYLKKAAELGSADACLILANIIYFDGMENVSPDIEQAIEYLKKAVELGSADACLILANIYFKGKNVSPNTDLGMEYFEKAARLGNAEACRILANIYFASNNISSNIELGHKYLEKAIKFGDKQFCFKTALSYMNKASINSEAPDYTLAIKCFIGAANKNYAPSDYSQEELKQLKSIKYDPVKIYANGINQFQEKKYSEAIIIFSIAQLKFTDQQFIEQAKTYSAIASCYRDSAIASDDSEEIKRKIIAQAKSYCDLALKCFDNKKLLPQHIEAKSKIEQKQQQITALL